MEDTTKKPRTFRDFWPIFIIVMIIVLGYGIAIVYITWPISLWNVDKAGVFGDSFGVLTSLFSGLAFAGIIITIFLQGEELKLQREELKKTREEFQMQNVTLKKQNFENTFFQMVRLHQDIVLAMNMKFRDAQSNEQESSGRSCFLNFYESLRKEYLTNKEAHPGKEEIAYIKVHSYPKFWEIHQNNLGHYFRHLYTIFKFIKNSDIENKRLYSNIVRAQLSDHELLVLFYNCISLYGEEKFKPLAEEFSLFNNIPAGLLLFTGHESFYQEAAFGNKTS